MQNSEEIKKRFLKSNFSMRLGCIASNLARLESFSKMPNNQKVINDLIEESKFFIEWTTPELNLDIQVELVNTQIQLALWNYLKNQKQISKDAGKLAEKILKLAQLSIEQK
jgi:hypothetical protein